MMKELKFEARFKKADVFNTTLHLVVYPEDGLKTANELYDLKEGQKIKVVISAKND